MTTREGRGRQCKTESDLRFEFAPLWAEGCQNGCVAARSQGETGFVASGFDRMRRGSVIWQSELAKGERVRYLNRPRLPTGPATSQLA